MTLMIGLLSLVGGIPALGPALVSPDTAQSLDLSGKWEGTLNGSQRLRLEKGKITIEWVPVTHPGEFTLFVEQIIDEGGGRLRTVFHGEMYLGIYRLTGDKLIICEQYEKFGYPVFFCDDRPHDLLILQRVKRFK